VTARVRLAASVAVAAMILPGCGSSSASGPSGTKLTVLAASSLKNVFPQIGQEFLRAHPGVTFAFSFAGTDAITAQIEQGAPADVFAGASTKYGDQLSADGLISSPAPFCTNQLVLVVPPSNPARITSPQDLATKDVKLVIGSETVPIGTYTRTVLANLDALYGSGYRAKALGHVVSTEVDAETVLTKVRTGEADAGFVYITDATAAGPDVKAISLPTAAQAVATYPIAVVKAGAHGLVAQQFVDFVLSPTGQATLRQAGFGPA
jgi:molybdate transport system substrate-binding protein